MEKNKRVKALEIRKFLLDMIADARKECRELTEEEQKLFDEQKNELIALSEEIQATGDKLDELESALPDIEEKADEEEEEKPAEEPAEKEDEEEPEKTEEEPAEEPKEEEEPAEKEDEETASEEPENEPEKEEKEDEINKDEEDINPDEKTEQKRKNHINMKENFSLIKAIRSVVNGDKQDAITSAVLNAGAEEFRKAGIGVNGQIQIPTEKRTFTVTDAHDDVIETEFTGLELPRYANRVLSRATWYTNLVGDLQIPILEAGEEARWEGETTASKDITNGTDSIKLTPHRISVETSISKQMLAQDSLSVEAAIREDLLNNLYNKLEATFLSANAAAGNVPAGIFAGKTANVVKDFKGICELEAKIEEQNYNGALEYVFSPAAKACFRQMTFGGGKTQRMVMEGNEIDGTPFSSTTNVAKNYFGLLDWGSIRIGQWSALDLVIDPYTKASNNQIKLVLNAYFDMKVAHPELVEYGTVVEPTNNPG